MTNLEIIQDAASKLDVYRKPAIDAAVELIDTILTSADLGSIQHETIKSIDIQDEIVIINTSYIVCGCSDTSRYVFPTSLLLEDDVERAATRYGKQLKLKDVEDRLASLKYQVEYQESILARLQADLVALTAQ